MIKKNKKAYLVTGAAGFIGSKVAELLLKQGYQVLGVDSLNNYYPPELKKHRLEILNPYKNFKFLKGSITDVPFIDSLFTDYSFSAVINLAAMAGVRYSIEKPQAYIDANTTGTLTLLEAMKKYKCSKIILASTSSLYSGQKMPFKEDKQIDRPISPYAASKRAGELMCYTYHHLFNIDVSILRYFTVYGPAGRPDMSPFKFIHSIINGMALPLYGTGDQKRDFTFIDDIARGTIAALRNTGYEIINLGRGETPVTINRMIEFVETYTGKKAIIKKHPSHSADMDATWAEIKKANNILEWYPQIEFEEGLKKTIKWHLANNSWLKTISF